MRKFIFLAIIAILIWLAVFLWPDDQLHLVFCDVGQGDAILISRGFKQILIDGGPDEKVIQCLSNNLPFWDRKIELVVSTHPDSDHITGLISVLERYQVQVIAINNLAKDSERFWRFRELALAEKAELYHPRVGESVKLAGLDLAVFWPKRDNPFKGLTLQGSNPDVLGATYEGDFNELSIVLRLEYGDFCAFLAGDISAASEPSSSPCQVLKVPHHGSKHATSEELLNQLQPQLAVISVGKNNFGHPSQEVLDRLASAGVRALRTDQAGEIEVITNGRRWRVKQDRY